MAYTKVFTNPHPNGWDNPSERPPITADVLQAHTDAIQAIDNYLAAGGGAGGGGGGDYVLPVATKTILGGVKVDGDTIAVTADGTISVTASGGAIKKTSDLTNNGDGSGSRYINESELAEVAILGTYSSLKNKPTIPTKISELENDKNYINNIPMASSTILGGVKIDNETITISSTGVISASNLGESRLADLQDTAISNIEDKQIIAYNATTGFWQNQAIDLGAGSRELTLAEYDALTAEQKADGTDYYITDADNINPDSIGTAGSLKPWLYDSDEEVVIGVYNGKPLYRKCWKLSTPLTVQTNIWTDTEIPNTAIEKIVKGEVMDEYDWNGVTLSNSFSFFAFAANGDGVVRVLNVRDAETTICYVTLEYTKTTDAENSGVNLMPYSFVQNGGSQVELYTNSVSSIAISNTNDMIPLVSVTVPAGYYILDAHFNWNNAGFRWYTQIAGGDFYAQSSGYDSAGHVVGAMQTVCKLTKETTLTYSIWGEKNTTLNGAEIKALKISDIHN